MCPSHVALNNLRKYTHKTNTEAFLSITQAKSSVKRIKQSKWLNMVLLVNGSTKDNKSKEKEVLVTYLEGRSDLPNQYRHGHNIIQKNTKQSSKQFN